MVLLIIILVVVTMLIAILLGSVFGIDNDVAAYLALGIMAGSIIAMIYFYLFTCKGRAIVRTWTIKDIRKKRIEREFHESWRRENRRFIAKDNKRVKREIDRMGYNEDETSDDDAYREAAAPTIYNLLHHSSNGS